MPVARLSSVHLLFDRGTMLLRDVDPGLDPSAIPGVLWDPRVQAYRTPAYRYRALRRDLARRAAPFSDEVRVPQLPLGSWSPIELRPYQEAALWAWELAQRRAVVVLPTGSGKTRLALAAMARAGSNALCLVPTRVLLAQWLHHIRRTYAGPVGCYGDGAHELAALTVATFDIVTLHLDLTAAERQAYEGWMTTFRTVHAQFRRVAPGASWEDFARTAARTVEGRRALDAFRRARKLVTFTEAKREMLRVLLHRHRDVRLVIFTADNESAYSIAREHLVMPFTCDIGRGEREEVLVRFREGTLRALVSARVLNEGIDVPDADVAIIVGGALGQREHVQRVGRLLQPREGKRALVYELVSRQTTEVRLARRRRAGLAPRGAAAV